jgi:hypothetical protein
MAAVTIATDVTDAGATAGVEVTGKGTLYLSGTFDKAEVLVQIARTNTPSKYKAPLARSFYKGGAFNISDEGTYFIRLFIIRPGDNTSVSAEFNQA